MVYLQTMAHKSLAMTDEQSVISIERSPLSLCNKASCIPELADSRLPGRLCCSHALKQANPRSSVLLTLVQLVQVVIVRSGRAIDKALSIAAKINVVMNPSHASIMDLESAPGS